MPTYVYETLGEEKRRFEIRQSMTEPALTTDPETGEPVRRVIVGGYGWTGAQASSDSVGSCGTGCGCH